MMMKIEFVDIDLSEKMAKNTFLFGISTKLSYLCTF
jgi:hypothetical protein